MSIDTTMLDAEDKIVTDESKAVKIMQMELDSEGKLVSEKIFYKSTGGEEEPVVNTEEG